MIQNLFYLDYYFLLLFVGLEAFGGAYFGCLFRCDFDSNPFEMKCMKGEAFIKKPFSRNSKKKLSLVFAALVRPH